MADSTLNETFPEVCHLPSNLNLTYRIVLKILTVDQVNTIFDEIFVSFLFQSICNQQVSRMGRWWTEDVEVIRKPVFPRTHISRSKSSLVRPVPVSSATRTIFIITASSSVVSYHDSTALTVFIERNTCLTCVLTCVGNILVTTSTLSTSVKFWNDKCITLRRGTSLDEPAFPAPQIYDCHDYSD